MKVKRTNLLTVGFIAMLLMASCGTKKENSYTINGTVPSQVTASKVYLYSIEEEEPLVIDSATISGGAFSFKGTAPDSIMLAIIHPGSLDEYPTVMWQVVLEPGNIMVDSAERMATGTPLNDGISDWMDQIYDIMVTEPDPSKISDFFVQHWSEHSSDFVGSYMLASMSMYLDFPLVDSLVRQVPPEVRSISMLKPFFEQVEAMGKMQPGKPFTDVALASIDGEPSSLGNYIGKGTYVLVDFWASWCGPCRQAMPQLQSTVKRHKDLTVIGIALSDEVDDTKKAIGDLGITWPVLSDPEGESAKAYGINAIPAMILFAPDGTIAARDFQVEELDSLLSPKL